MANIQTRSSILGVMVETTEGTPVLPATGTDIVVLQPDFTMQPAFDSIENEEIRASIGAAKSIQGLENPTASGSQYLKGSGTEGAEPQLGRLFYGFFGAKSAATAEFDTIAGSTQYAFNVNTGEGASFERGQGVLLKDSLNGFRIRALASVSGDVLTPIFGVPVAPLSSVNLGKCVLYKPANSDHPTLTLTHYLGNGGAKQVMAGTRVMGFSADVNPENLVNVNFNFEGISFYYDPIEITASTRYLDWIDDDGTWAAAIATGWYKDPVAVAEALQAAMQAANAGETPTVTYSDTTGKFTIKTTGTLLTLKWNTGANTANTIGTKIGFLVAADDSGTGATTGYTSDNAQSFAFPFTPDYDDTDPSVAKYQEVMLGDADDYVCFQVSQMTISGTNTKANIGSVCAESGRSGSIISGRDFEVTMTHHIQKWEVDQWARFRKNQNTSFQYSWGPKTGGNWIPGKAGFMAAPKGTLTAFEIADQDGLAIVNLTFKPFVDSDGAGEFYVGQV